MECKFCKCDTFIGHQVIRADILVSGQNGDFYENMPGGLETAIYDSGTPYGPFQCCGCGTVYDELKDNEEPVSGPVEGWSWYEYKDTHYSSSVFVEWDQLDFIADIWARQYFGPQVKAENGHNEEQWHLTITQLGPEYEPKVAELFKTYNDKNSLDYHDRWDANHEFLVIPARILNQIFSQVLLMNISDSYAGYNGVIFLQSPSSLQMLKMKGDIFDSGADIYVHQVNCHGVMGAGLAKQVKLKYPEVYTPYRALCLEKGDGLLGTALISQTNDGHYIANCFGQTDYGTNGRKTDYTALSSSLRQVREFVEQNDLSVALPYGLGSGLAGGDWMEILQIITETFEGYGKVCIWER